MGLENISKINKYKKTLNKLDFLLNALIIINFIVTLIALIIDRTNLFPTIDAQPLFNIDNLNVVIILPIILIIKKIINNKIKKLQKNIINLKNK